jgi:ABC-type transport system substrate-binding protein
MRAGRFTSFVVTAVVLILVATACASEETAREPGAEGGTLVDLQNFATGEPDHIDPGLAGVLEGAQIGALLFDSLTEFDFSGDGDPVLKGQVAKSFKSSDGGKTWVFTLKDDQVFSDGTEVRPSDFVAAWNVAASKKYASEIAYLFDPIEGGPEVEAGEATEMSGLKPDDEKKTLTVTLNFPFADFPAVVSHPIFSPKTPDGVTKAAKYEQGVMIGNGPFKMAEKWEHEVQITLERNDNWNGGIYDAGVKARLDRIEFKISKDIDSAYADFEAGNADTARIPSGRFKEATDAYPHDTDPSLGLYDFYFNMEGRLGGEKNLKLRQAISKIIDREAINDAAYDGTRRLPSGATPPGVVGFKAGLCGDLCTRDVAGAKKLIAEWKAEGGAISGGPIKVNFNTGSGHEDVVAIMQQNLKELGFDSTLDGRDPTTYFTEMRKGDCEFCRAGWIWDYPVYDNGDFALFHGDSVDGDNLSRLKAPEIDKAINDARKTVDPEERAALYREAEKIALQDYTSLVPVNWYAMSVVYTKDVGNFVSTPLQFVLYERATVKH